MESVYNTVLYCGFIIIKHKQYLKILEQLAPLEL